MTSTKRKKSGFTLLEAIVVVAVLAVITAIAVPGVAALQSRLHMAELDAYARQIYLAAQNELAAMKASGALPAWANGKTYAAVGRPSDYADAAGDPAEGTQAGWKRLVAVPGTDLARALDSVEGATAAGGQAYIELDPVMGHVYAVFFAEESFPYESEESESPLPRDYDARKAHSPRLGYFGGGSLAALPETLPDIVVEPEIVILNGEELVVRITFPEDRAEGGLPPVIDAFTATLTITGRSNGAVLTKTFDKADLIGDELYLILDSLDSDNAFAEVTKSSGGIRTSIEIDGVFIPGEDLTASVTIEGQSYASIMGVGSGMAQIRGNADSGPFNSLFASREDDSGSITVSHVRHLNNLRKSVYDPSEFESEPTAPISIHHQGIIDFDSENWTEGEDYWTLDENPLSSFSPIDVHGGLVGFAYLGNKGMIANFPIVGGEDTGLFRTTDGSVFENLTLENCSAKGISNVGVLVGSAADGSFHNIMLEDCFAGGSGSNVGTLAGSAGNTEITGCGAHLTYYRTRMTSWITEHTVSGQSSVGGLVGRLNGGSVTGSYGAVYVYASGDNAGGLIGHAENARITDVYASGDVDGRNYLGGLVGRSVSVDIQNCYTTSDVTGGGDYIGGILGGGDSATSLKNAAAYGMTPMISNRVIGRIAGSPGVNAEKSTCLYLEKQGWGLDNDVGSPKTYAELLDADLTDENASVNFPTYPYDEDLQGNYFPFPRIAAAASGGANPLMAYTDGKLIHHGDWPLEIELLDVNLVYYEKYDNGNGTYSYGYFADAYLGSGFTGQGSSTLWNTDSLRYPGKNGVSREKAVCVEDGYALLCTTDLYLRGGQPGYSFSLDPKVDTGNSWSPPVTVTGNAPIVEEEGDVTQDNSLLLDDNASLRFTSRTGGRNVYYTLNGAKVYRLPFDLQITERVSATSFWEELTVSYYEKDEYGDLSGKQVSETYWYCPDFAKNAVNPNPDPGISNDAPDEPFGSDTKVYVRSARQLNGLGRSTYYWRREGTSGSTAITGDQIYFVQETDIDYYTYAGTGGAEVEKRYCGVTYNLMDTSARNAYRNKPIGMAMDKNNNSAPGNFRNNYNGQGNWILDYCQEWQADQFGGLFGEARVCTLQNIVMKASGRMKERPYIRAGFVADSTSYYSVIGVGGIVGLLYVDSYSTEAGSIASMENCAISGYEITYDPVSTNSDNRKPGIGGLVGLCLGNIENCSAVSMILQGEQSQNETLCIGGLVGAIDYDLKPSIENCYAGMNTLIAAANKSTVYTGGILGGNINIPGGNSASSGTALRDLTDCYSFRTLRKTLNSTAEPQVLIYPIVQQTNNISQSGCYYLKQDGIPETALGEARDHFAMCEKPFAEESYPVNPMLAGGNYPYTAVVEHDGTLVHYGDWPDQSPQIVYYEKTKSGGETHWDYYAGVTQDYLDRENKAEILDWGYALLGNGQPVTITIEGSGGQGGQEWKDEEALQKHSDDVPASLRLLKDEVTKALQSGDRLVKVTVTGEKLGDDGEPEETTVIQYVNALFAAAVFDSSGGGTASRNDEGELTAHPFEIRTPVQLRNIADFRGSREVDGAGYYFLQSHAIDAGELEPAENAAIIPEFDLTYDGDGNTIAGLKHPLFGEVADTAAVRKAALVDVEIEAKESAAPLALANGGSITESFAVGSVASEENAAGLVLANSGSISKSYANCRVTGGNAAGFVWENANGGSIEYCYSGSDHSVGADEDERGYITGTAAAAGFVGEIGGGSIANCYSVAAVKGNPTVYGFGPKEDGVVDGTCHWLRQTEEDDDTAFNSDIDPDSGGGTARAAAEIVALIKSDSSWVAAPASHPGDDALRKYPYPGVGLDHYGDWPQLTPALEGKIGVARLYSSGGWNPNYYARGQAIDLATGEPSNFNTSGNSTGQAYLLVMAGEGIILDDWKIEYTTGSNWTTLTRTSDVTVSNRGDYTAYRYNISGSFNNLRVRLTHESGASYIFNYESNTFTYDSDAN